MTIAPHSGTATANPQDLAKRRASRSTRSPSVVRSTRKRSPSPSITFTTTSLPVDSAKGVKDITRNVLRQLEGISHLEVRDMAVPDEDGKEHHTNGLNSTQNGASKQGHKANLNGQAKVNGNGTAKAVAAPVDYEIPRKLLHGSIGFLALYLYLTEGDPKKVVVTLWSALAIIYPADMLRLRSRRFARLYESLLGFLMRENEKESVNGVVWYILGANTVLSLFPIDVATVAILILSWADTAASTFGRLYGRNTPKLPERSPVLGLPFATRKSVAGFIASSITGACIAIGFWGYLAPLRSSVQDTAWTWEGGINNAGGGGLLGLAVIGIVAGLVSGVAEALDLGAIDDNLSLPIISGTCLYGFFKLFEFASSAVSSWIS
ncbi:hypothetical protein FA15DRAFT_646236 [Coprinopsis marcescibilis]|uniref:Phosphatidate cytidylyltransferase n=1 Tax=Coprinopsis marcescibilis TaxID=230819 RepID=A0A5C3KLY2_COPMA|nr:hypothetical protein FA15DRAFT_646236 [Coprinopsis marcescibilis]